MGQIQSAQTLGQNPGFPTGDEFDEIVTGGYFLPEDRTTKITLTSEFLIKDHRDNRNAMLLDLSGYFGGLNTDVCCYGNHHDENSHQPDSGYIGKWSEDIDKEAAVYYIVDGCQIHKLIFSKPIDHRAFTDAFGIVMIANIDDKMMYCYPDEGDVMFDTYEEAEDYIKCPLKAEDIFADEYNGEYENKFGTECEDACEICDLN